MSMHVHVGKHIHVHAPTHHLVLSLLLENPHLLVNSLKCGLQHTTCSYIIACMHGEVPYTPDPGTVCS